MYKFVRHMFLILVMLFIFMIIGCVSDYDSKKTPGLTPEPTQGKDDDEMYVPQLSTTWFEAKKIVGLNDTEFISDFLLIQDVLGRWHCIGIGGQGHIQDSFFHAVGDKLLEPFSYVERVYSNGDKSLDETDWMWAPFAIYTKDGNNAYMFYHHQTISRRSEMRMLVSTDEKLDTWVPLNHEDLEDGCIAFVENGCRDACIFFDEDLGEYLMYYAEAKGICLRTSQDLIHWSESKVVMTAPPGFQAAESPYVVKKFGFYYLFVSGFDYGRIAVYASKDHANFGHPSKDLIGELNGHAPEIVTVDGRDYIACAAINATDGKETYLGASPGQHNIVGVYIQELKWVKQSDAVWLKLPEKQKKELPVVKADPDYYWSFDESLKELITETESEDPLDEEYLIDGYIGKALWFDGMSKYFMPEFDFKIDKNFTISFYIQMDNTNGDYNVFLSKGHKTTGHLEIYTTPSGRISFYQQEIGIHDTDGLVCDGEWHHVVFTYDGEILICYLDGDEIYNCDVKAEPVNIVGTQIVFGCFGPSKNESHYFFQGAIDELKFFNRVLAKEELGFKN